MASLDDRKTSAAIIHSGAPAEDADEQSSPPPCAAPSASMPQRSRLAWALIVALIVIQAAMFRQFALREVVWSYPPNHDQLGFLSLAYAAYDVGIDRGPSHGIPIAASVRRPPDPRRIPGCTILPPVRNDLPDFESPRGAVGLLMSLQAFALFLFTGPGRLAALSLNELWFIVFQIALIISMRSLSGRWSVAFVAWGLLLAVATPFFWAGGLFDFRIDFTACCLYGTFLSLVLRSRMFLDRRWTLAATGCAGVLFLFRFIALVYLAGTLGLILVYLVVRRWRTHGSNDDALRRRRRNQLRHALMTAAILALIAVPVVISRAPAIAAYYGHHVVGQEKQLRAEENGIADARAALMFYPRSLLRDHLGAPMVWAAAAVLIASLGLRASGRPSRGTRGRVDFDWGAAIGLIVAALLVPLVALTADQAKSPVVGGIMVGPAVLAVMLACVGLSRMDAAGYRSPPAARYVWPALAAGVLALGAWTHLDHLARRTALARERPEIEKLTGIYDRIGMAARTLGLLQPKFAFDSTSDSMNFVAFGVIEYERTGVRFMPAELLANTIMSREDPDVFRRLDAADFVVLTQRQSDDGRYEMPFDKVMRALKPRMFDRCRQTDVLLAHERLGAPFNCEVSVFARPRVRVQAPDADGWMTAGGTRILAPARMLRERPNIDVWGPPRGMPGAPHSVRAMLGADAGPPASVPAMLMYDRAGYHVSLKIDPARLPRDGPAQIDLAFAADPNGPALAAEARVLPPPDGLDLNP